MRRVALRMERDVIFVDAPTRSSMNMEAGASAKLGLTAAGQRLLQLRITPPEVACGSCRFDYRN